MTKKENILSNFETDIFQFEKFVEVVNSILQRLDNPMGMIDLKIDLHTLKGILGIYDFHQTILLIHDLEQSLEDRAGFGPLEIKRELLRIRESFNSLESCLMKTLSCKDSGVVAVKKEKRIQKLAEEFIKNFPEKDVKVTFDLSEDLMWKELQILESVIIQILHNCIDHGIESKIDRIRRLKSPSGNIQISLRKSESFLVLKISDDGGGIEVDKLQRKAQHIISDKKNTGFDILFIESLSIKNSVTLNSGRGMGMNVVKKCIVDELGGSIQISTDLGKGTIFEIKVPLKV